MATMRLIDGVEDRDAVKALVFEDLTEVGVIVEDRRSLFAGLSCLTIDHEDAVKRSNDASMVSRDIVLVAGPRWGQLVERQRCEPPRALMSVHRCRVGHYRMWFA